MARSTEATLNNLVSEEGLSQIRDIYQEEVQKNVKASIEKMMFPEELIYSKQVTQTSLNKNIAAVQYTTDNSVPPTSNMTEQTRDELYNLPVKKEKTILDMQEFSLVNPKSIKGDELTKVKSSISRTMFGLDEAFEIRNRLEVWKYLTLGLMGSVGGDETLPLYGFDRTSYATYGVCYNWQPNTKWFDVSGNVAAGADIMGDLVNGVNYMYNNGYSDPGVIWMNSITYAALIGNTALLKGTYGLPAMWNPIDMASFLGLDTKRVPKALRISSWTVGAVNTPIYIYDGRQTLQNADHTTTEHKYLPDYYVLFTPSKIGVRKTGLTAMTNMPGRAFKSKIIQPDYAYYQNIEFAAEERSHPFPSALGTADGNWKTHITLYVKSLT